MLMLLPPVTFASGFGMAGIDSGVGHKRFLGVEAAYIANFSHELWAQGWANTEHIHHNGIFRQMEASDCISCLRAASAAEVALSWNTACSTKSFAVSDFGITPMCPLAGVNVQCLFSR